MESILSFPLIILLSTLYIVSSQSQYSLPDYHFINCGSKSDITFTGKRFIGDENRSTFKFSGGSQAVNNNPASISSEIYQTARVFTKKSWYELEADENNTFVMVNLHFSPFFYNRFELSDSKFDVSVSGFPMLSDFIVGNSTLIKSFIIPIGKERKFKIEFAPSSSSSPAFVNAIEAFTTPSDLVRDTTPTQVSPTGKIGDIGNISSSYAFSPIYRINVGGQSIDVERDSLRRTWIPDDKFIVESEVAENITGTVNYKEYATIYDAPVDVYNSAKKLKPNSSLGSNLTWSFMVNKSAVYLVRAHFCDINSTGLNDPNDAFNFFIYHQYKEKISPGNIVFTVQVPFYRDFVVDSVESGFVNVSIGAIRGFSQPVLLNGLEIMELVKNSGVVDIRNDGKKSSKKMFIVVGCVAASVVFVLLIGFLIGLKYRKTKPMGGVKTESNVVPSYGRSSYTSINVDFSINNISPIPNLNLNLRFQFVDILRATNSFDEKLMIGQGGFGKVYRGTLPDGKTVAVKRGQKGHGQGRPEFITEIMVLSKIRHQHLVTLIGYCDEKAEMILVYEYMEKGTLQDHLYDTKEDDVKLSWSQRLEICISATRGLHYLHTGSDAGIIHRDVKSTNILLNENYVAKVADFGISRLDNLEESEMDIKGSFGYLDPEYISCMKLTQKSDVYSFGVVLLEVLCARPALDNTLPRKEANLADWATNHIKDGTVEKIIDSYLVDQINQNSLRKYLDTVERCLKNTGDERPSMIDVLWDLEYALKLQQMVVDREPYEDSTMNTSLQLSMSTFDRLPSKCNDDDSQVNDISYPSESQVFSQLKIDEAR